MRQIGSALLADVPLNGLQALYWLSVITESNNNMKLNVTMKILSYKYMNNAHHLTLCLIVSYADNIFKQFGSGIVRSDKDLKCLTLYLYSLKNRKQNDFEQKK